MFVHKSLSERSQNVNPHIRSTTSDISLALGPPTIWFTFNSAIDQVSVVVPVSADGQRNNVPYECWVRWSLEESERRFRATYYGVLDS
jgi:hypothetical protein